MLRRSFLQSAAALLAVIVPKVKARQPALPAIRMDGREILNGGEVFAGATWADAPNRSYRQREALAWLPAENAVFDPIKSTREHFWGEVVVQQRLYENEWGGNEYTQFAPTERTQWRRGRSCRGYFVS